MPKFRLISINSKLKKLLTLLPLLVLLNSCDPGCVESYQFDSENTFINAKPTADGIFGGPYNSASGGENAAWHTTGLRSDGGQLVFEIRGAWTAWDDANNQAELDALQECTICAKKNNVENCICQPNTDSVPEKNTFGQPLSGVDCSDGGLDQDDASKCTCTKNHGTINDFGTYFIATDYQEKSEALKLPDQQNTCKYTGGLGLYVGLFGKNGNTMPLRVYQVFPTQKICDISSAVPGKCIDDSGRDQTKYLYKSPDGKTLIKDDRSGNNGDDEDLGDDQYHESGELVKLIINDRYYQDNFGGYDVNFMGGFVRQQDSGLLEFIVGTVEDEVLGKISAVGKREGGAIEFLYNSIVKDSSFILIVQMCLIMYIVLFGIWVLNGSLQISQKEMSKRILKIALVIFFTTESSWYFYNQIVVGLFKDGMDAIIAIFMNGSDSTLDQTSLIVTSQMDRANSVSQSTRFSYVDEVIKKLLSASASKKIWSLFLGEWFGLLYIPAIYLLIFAFIYIMLTAALVYVTALLRLVFVLCLGPIFMVTVLFNKTDEIFKRWLSFMAAQSIQIIALFLVIYLFVILIDVNFNTLLSYRACTTNVNFGLFNINFLRSESNRGLVEWVMMFAKIGTLLFLLKMIMEKIPGFAGRLVSVNGMAADNVGNYISSSNDSAFGLAKGIMGSAAKAAFSGISKGVPATMSAGLSMARATGLTSIGNSIRQAIPFRSPVNLYRDHQIDKIISAQQKAGKAAGYKGKDLDAFVRKGVHDEISKRTSTAGKKPEDAAAARANARSFNITGISNKDAINARLNKKLVEEPFKKAIKDQAAELKKEYAKKGEAMPLGKEAMAAALRPRLEKWAEENSSVDKDKFMSLLDKKEFNSMIKKHGELTSSEAAKMLAGNEEGTKAYLQHLQNRQFEKERKRRETSGTLVANFKNAAKDFGRGLQRNAAYNPKMARENFLRKVQYEEQRNSNRRNYGLGKQALDAMGINPEKKSPIQRVNVLDKLARRKEIKEMVKKAEKDALAGYLKEGYEKDRNAIEKERDDKIKTLIDAAKADPRLDIQDDRKKAEDSAIEKWKLLEEKKEIYEQKLNGQINSENAAAQAKYEKAMNILSQAGTAADVKIVQVVEDAKKEYENTVKDNEKIIADIKQAGQPSAPAEPSTAAADPEPAAAAPAPTAQAGSTTADPNNVPATADPNNVPADTATASAQAASPQAASPEAPAAAPVPDAGGVTNATADAAPEAPAPKATPMATPKYADQAEAAAAPTQDGVPAPDQEAAKTSTGSQNVKTATSQEAGAAASQDGVQTPNADTAQIPTTESAKATSQATAAETGNQQDTAPATQTNSSEKLGAAIPAQESAASMTSETVQESVAEIKVAPETSQATFAEASSQAATSQQESVSGPQTATQETSAPESSTVTENGQEASTTKQESAVQAQETNSSEATQSSSAQETVSTQAAEDKISSEPAKEESGSQVTAQENTLSTQDQTAATEVPQATQDLNSTQAAVETASDATPKAAEPVDSSLQAEKVSEKAKEAEVKEESSPAPEDDRKPESKKPGGSSEDESALMVAKDMAKSGLMDQLKALRAQIKQLTQELDLIEDPEGEGRNKAGELKVKISKLESDIASVEARIGAIG